MNRERRRLEKKGKRKEREEKEMKIYKKVREEI